MGLEKTGEISLEKLEILEDLGVSRLKRLRKVGSSYAFFVPKGWVDCFCLKVDGTYRLYLEVQEDGTIILRRPNESEIRELANSVKPKES